MTNKVGDNTCFSLITQFEDCITETSLVTRDQVETVNDEEVNDKEIHNINIDYMSSSQSEEEAPKRKAVIVRKIYDENEMVKRKMIRGFNERVYFCI